MCVNIISEELTAKEDIIVYKIVRLYEDNFVSRFRTYERSIQYSYEEKEIQFGDGFQSQFSPEGRTPQNQTGNNGTILHFRLNQLTESPFTYSEGIYTYVIESRQLSYSILPRVIHDTKILRCVVPKGTKYKKATHMLVDCMLVEKLIPIEVIQCV